MSMKYSYPKTIYHDYSLNELHALFNSGNWRKNMNISERIQACQEVENRYAAENGVPPCIVRHEPMNDACYGVQRGNGIYLNTYLLVNDSFYSSYTDEYGETKSVYAPVDAPGWNILDTVYHEGTHGIQWYQGRSQSIYIDPETDGNLYRIQSDEKEAYAKAQVKTLEALGAYEQETGRPDPERQGYISAVKQDSYVNALKEAAEFYDDPNIEDTLQRVIEDYQTGYCPDNPGSTYQEIRDLIDEQQGMSPDVQRNASVQSGVYQYDAETDTFEQTSEDSLPSASESFQQLNDSMDRTIAAVEEINSSLHEMNEDMEHMYDSAAKTPSSDGMENDGQEEDMDIDMTD